METKGVAFIARKKMIVTQFGEGAWNSFINDLSEKESYFKKNIIPSDLIPIENFYYSPMKC